MEENLREIIKKSVSENIKGKSTTIWVDSKKYYISFEFREILQVECQICRNISDGKNKVVDQSIVEPLTVCNECLNDFGNQDYDSLTRKLEKRKSLSKTTYDKEGHTSHNTD